MKSGKFLKSLIIAIVLSCFTCITAFAGTYTVTQYVSGSFGEPTVTVTNSAGVKYSGGALWLSSTVTNVTSITQSVILNSISSGSSLYMNVFYSTDGVNFYIGTTVYCPLNTQVQYTMNFGSAKSIKALFFLPNTATIPGYSYSVWTPQFSRLLTDNTAPSISLTEQSYYSKTSVTISASITDSESGLSVRKWAQGVQSSSYFTSSGTSFYSTFSVSANGYYTVYAKDVAGNEVIRYINVTKMDTTPPVISASASTEWNTSNIITTNITDSQSGVTIKKWAFGNYSASYFLSSGYTLSDSSITVTNNGVYTIYAKDVAGNESIANITVSYVDNTVSVTHPISVDYIINPNLIAPFIASDIRLVNNSRIKVSVSVQELTSATGGSLYFLNASPYTFSNWNTLNNTQSKIYIALGLRVKETTTSANSWYSINAYNPIYATNITSKTLLGILNPNGAFGSLALSAKHGLAFDVAYTARHNLVLVFETI